VPVVAIHSRRSLLDADVEVLLAVDEYLLLPFLVLEADFVETAAAGENKT